MINTISNERFRSILRFDKFANTTTYCVKVLIYFSIGVLFSMLSQGNNFINSFSNLLQVGKEKVVEIEKLS